MGNFSYSLGEIDAYNPVTGAFLGTLDSNAAWQGLWALTFGSGSASGGSSDILYFTTGLNAETKGCSRLSRWFRNRARWLSSARAC